MNALQRFAAIGALFTASLLGTGCSTTALMLSASGVATDTSIPWAIVKHVHEKLTDGDPLPCHALDSVQRALSARCGPYQPGSLHEQDIASSALQGCPLLYATQDPHFWPLLPELLDKGAQPERCTQSPLLRLAQAQACPDFSAASPQVLSSLAWLAEADARAIRHDVMRMLSCPSARTAGLHRVLDRWFAAGALNPETLGFGALGALHPDYLHSPFARQLEAGGHTAQAAFAAYDGKLPPGFEAAVRASHWAAIDWWLVRRPSLVKQVTTTQGDQLPWLPLARVLAPSFLEHPETQGELITFLLARGADPHQRLPYNASQSVLAYARAIKSPHASLLEQLPAARPTAVFASSEAPERGGPRLLRGAEVR